ncbi:MAG: flagellar motor switch protein FliM [Oscillospiraceae bacterium]
MPDILSQDQIDALLHGMSSGDVEINKQADDVNKVKEYDFYSPKKFTKEQLRNVESLHENMGRLLSSYFSGVMRVFSEATVMTVEEQRYYEYNNALPDTALLGIMDLKPTDNNINEFTIMIDMSANIAFFMIDRLLGGSGVACNLNRDLTDIEMGIMRNLFSKFTRYIKDAWCDYIDLTVTLDTVETNPRLIQIYAPEDIVVIVPFKLQLEEFEGTFDVCIPALGLEEVLRSFTSKYARMSQKMSDETRKELYRKIINDALYDSDLAVKAVFDEVQLELTDILHLRVDDVIKLEKVVGSDIKLIVDDAPWFTGKLGSVKTNKAVKITGMC